MAAVMVAFVDFLISFAILARADGVVSVSAGLADLAVAGFACVAFLASIGIGLWITALNVKYRDFRYVIPFIVQLGLYVSPVGFSSSIVPERWRLALFAQPDGRRHRWVSLVPPWRAKSALFAGSGAQLRVSPPFSCGSEFASSGKWKRALPI